MTKTKAAFDATEGPGLARLRRAKNAERIREATLDDQRKPRAEAKARAKNASPEPHSGPQAAEAGPEAPKARRKAKAPAARQRAVYAPSPVPTPAEAMPGMSRANALKYVEAAKGAMPTPPDFSKPSYAPDRGRLATLVKAGRTSAGIKE